MGLNAEFGPIYGESRPGSFQAVGEKMKAYMDLNENSYFIDVGCGGGKPNLPVAQDPGVAISIGIEVVENRWAVCMKHFSSVLKEAKEQEGKEMSPDEQIGYNCYFLNMDATEATSFDPFTHVYMFDIGFPPNVIKKISTIFNNSSTSYLVCYHNVHLIVDEYKFDVQLIQEKDNPMKMLSVCTYLHGSGQVFHCYFYKRNKMVVKNQITIDSKIQNAVQHIKMELDHLHQFTGKECSNINGKRIVGMRSCTLSKLK